MRMPSISRPRLMTGAAVRIVMFSIRCCIGSRDCGRVEARGSRRESRGRPRASWLRSILRAARIFELGGGDVLRPDHLVLPALNLAQNDVLARIAAVRRDLDAAVERLQVRPGEHLAHLLLL